MWGLVSERDRCVAVVSPSMSCCCNKREYCWCADGSKRHPWPLTCPSLSSTPTPLCRRVMLKVSGEALEGSQDFGIDPTVLQTIASEVAAAASEGVQIAIVVGGGK